MDGVFARSFIISSVESILLTQKELDPDFVAFNSENRRYQFLFRFYLPLRAMFSQIDPLLLFSDYGRPLDSYGYVRMNPLRFVDPLGLGIVYRGGQNIGVKPDPTIVSKCIKASSGILRMNKQCFNECCCEFSLKVTCSGTWGLHGWVSYLDDWIGALPNKPFQYFATEIGLKYKTCVIPPKGSVGSGGTGQDSRCWDDNHCIPWCKTAQLSELAKLTAQFGQTCGEVRSLPQFDSEEPVGGLPTPGGGGVTAWPGYDEGKPMPNPPKK